jgi:gamma-glutamylcyclotransferase (GGCT)/AIG2-like uncharacterized protein YtfP
MKVFVYGSLRNGGFLNSHYFTQELFLGCAKTSQGYALYDITSGAFPAMVESKDQSQVCGEIYEADKNLLDRLDRAEGHPNFYCRKEIKLDNGETVFAYLLPAEEIVGYPKVEDGDWMPFIIRANEKKDKEISRWFV